MSIVQAPVRSHRRPYPTWLTVFYASSLGTLPAMVVFLLAR